MTVFEGFLEVNVSKIDAIYKLNKKNKIIENNLAET